MARILLSALSARRGGGQTYLRRIVGSFPADPAHELTIFSAHPIPGLFASGNVKWERAPQWTSRPLLRFLFGALFFRFVWKRRHDFDAVYFAGGSFDMALPPGTAKVVAFRNMLPFDLEARRRYHWGWNRFRHWLLRYVQGWAFRRADLVIFISDYARATIDAMVPNRRGQSVVIPHGAQTTDTPLDPSIASRLPERFVLYLSILDPYKAQIELVEAWSILRKRGEHMEKLVLAGPDAGPYADRVRQTVDRLGLGDEVVLLGTVSHDQVTDLARRAALNLFMSSCENCPNILLELLKAEVPLLVSNREPMPELGGPALAYVDPYDVPAIAEALETLLGDSSRRAELARAARERGTLYDWQSTGERTWQAILACASSR